MLLRTVIRALSEFCVHMNHDETISFCFSTEWCSWNFSSLFCWIYFRDDLFTGFDRLRGSAKAVDIWRLETKVEAGPIWRVSYPCFRDERLATEKRTQTWLVKCRLVCVLVQAVQIYTYYIDYTWIIHESSRRLFSPALALYLYVFFYSLSIALYTYVRNTPSVLLCILTHRC